MYFLIYYYYIVISLHPQLAHSQAITLIIHILRITPIIHIILPVLQLMSQKVHRNQLLKRYYLLILLIQDQQKHTLLFHSQDLLQELVVEVEEVIIEVKAVIGI